MKIMRQKSNKNCVVGLIVDYLSDRKNWEKNVTLMKKHY